MSSSMNSELAETAETARRKSGRQPTFDREEAIGLSLGLFWRHGHQGVSITDLTTAIGIAAPSLYHAFGSKAGLYREVLRRYGAGGMTADEIEQASSSFEAARQALERGVEVVSRPGRPLGCMVSSGMLMTSPEGAELAAEVRAMRAAFREALQGRIRRDVEDGCLPPGTDAASLARFLAAVLQGISVQALDGASATELRPLVSSALAAWPLFPSHSRE